MTGKPFSFMVNDRNAVVRMSNKGGPTVTIFKAGTREKAEGWLQIYLTLSIEDRHKLIDACAP